MDLRVAGLNRLLAHRQKDAFGRPRHLPFRALAEDDAEAVAADAADDIAGAQQAVEALAHRQQHGIADLRPEGVVDDGELVDADHQKGAGNLRAAVVFDGVLQRLAQAHVIEMAGELVEAGHALQARLVLLARRDQAQAAHQALRHAVAGADHAAAVMHPHHRAVVGADAVFAIIGCVVADMGRRATSAAAEYPRD